MQTRIRLATSPRNLLSAPALGIVEKQCLPKIGDIHEDASGRYRVIKVMEHVDPEQGCPAHGPIMYVVKV